MDQANPATDSPQQRHGLLRDYIKLVKRKDSDRYEIVPIQETLSFEKGFFVVIRACQLLAQKNDGVILVGAGPSGAGKSAFSERVLNFMPSIISPRISFEVSVRLLGGLMALGYSIATILKSSSHVFSDDKVVVKIDWLEQLNRRYIQVQGKERLFVRHIAELLGLDGSYIPRTYIEQIQLEKLVNDVMALPDDLRTQLSIGDENVSNLRKALSRASADRVAMRNKHIKGGVLNSSTRKEKNIAKHTRSEVDDGRFERYPPESPAINHVIEGINRLSEQISILNERFSEFSSRMEEFNSRFSSEKTSMSQQNLAGQGSSSSIQLNKDSPLLEELLHITEGQRQIMHQLDNLKTFIHEKVATITG